MGGILLRERENRLKDFKDKLNWEKTMADSTASNNQPIITKYRPISFEEVLGNELMIKVLKDAIRSASTPHLYLFEGPTGVGKSTLAYIVARELNANVQELCAATNSSIDDTRKIVEMAGYKPLDGKAQMILIEEAHNLSPKAWEPLLLLTEHPPAYLYFAFCTTDVKKVPPAIKSRATVVKLSSVKPTDIEDLLTLVCEVEGWIVTDSTFQAIVQAAEGSPRKALSILQLGHSVATREELSSIVAEVESETAPIMELCRYLVTGGRNWRQISSILNKVEDNDGLDSQVLGYLTNAMLRSEEAQARMIWTILEAIMQPRQGWNKKAQISAAIGRLCFGAQVF